MNTGESYIFLLVKSLRESIFLLLRNCITQLLFRYFDRLTCFYNFHALFLINVFTISTHFTRLRNYNGYYVTLFLDYTVNGRYGGACHRQRITSCVNNLEAMVLLFNVIIHNSASHGCVRRAKWALICGDAGCEHCLLYFVDCPGLTKPYIFGTAGQSLLCQLPLLRREECLISGHGRVFHADVDLSLIHI